MKGSFLGEGGDWEGSEKMGCLQKEENREEERKNFAMEDLGFRRDIRAMLLCFKMEAHHY